MKDEIICNNCKYHYIEELTFDYPQSCCRKRSETTEQWCKCNDFEYGDRYIEQLQKENKKYKEVIDKAIEYIKIYRSYQKNDNKDYLKGRDEIGCLDICQVDELLDILKGVE